MGTILAIDSAHHSCSAAVLEEENLLSFEKKEMERGQAEEMLPMIVRVMEKSGKTYQELSCIAVTIGPGSFTGVRVALAAARGIALASGLPMIGISVLEAVAYMANKKKPDIGEVCVVLETKRDDFYSQRFKGRQPLSLPAAVGGDVLINIKEAVFIGNGIERLIKEYGSVPSIEIEMPAADTVARLAAEKTPTQEFPSPLYLREADVTVCKK